MATVEQVTNHVDKRTDLKAGKRIDLRIEFFAALDEFCIERHFWWRRAYTSFSTAVGTQNYDLTVTGNPKATDLQEIEDIVAVTPVTGICGGGRAPRLLPILDSAGIVAAMNPSGNSPPSNYMIAPKTLRTVQLGAPADQVAAFGVIYYAIPAVSDPDEEEAIPLVPDWLHWGLYYALERRVYEVLYGQQDERFAMANGRYEQFVELAGKRPSWVTGEVLEARTATGQVHATAATWSRGRR